MFNLSGFFSRDVYGFENPIDLNNKRNHNLITHPNEEDLERSYKKIIGEKGPDLEESYKILLNNSLNEIDIKRTTKRTNLSEKIIINKSDLILLKDFSKIENIFNKLFPNKISLVELTKDIDESELSYFFRDSAVFLPNGTLSITAPLLSVKLVDLAFSAIPSTSQEMLQKLQEDNIILFGRGFELPNVLQLISLARAHKIPFTLGKAPIEGGNCFVFECNGRRMAIVGIMSLCATVAQLIDEDIDVEDQPPTPHAISLTRNMEYFQRYLTAKINKKFIEKEEIWEKRNEYCSILQRSLSPLEMKKNYEKSFKNQTILVEAKNRIAADLDVLPPNLLIIEQIDYHIDMEMLVDRKKRVLINDEEKVTEFLNQVIKEKKPEGELKKLVDSYLNNSKEKKEKYKKLNEKRINQIISKGIDVVRVPFCFKSEEFKSVLNYCNSIIVTSEDEEENDYFITTGPTSEIEKQFHDYFEEYFESNFSEYKLLAIEGLSEQIARGGGGIHCLSMNTI